MIENPRYKTIYKRYLKEALLVDKEGFKVLKADCSNEFNGYPLEDDGPALLMYGIAPLMEAKVTCIEIDESKVNFCKEKYPDVEFITGDIRKLPFDFSYFDVVLDFSTLDHIDFDEGLNVIEGYSNVLKTNGNLVLVVWCSYEQNEHMENSVWYYNKDEIRERLRKFFVIDYEENILHETGYGDLMLWRCRKCMTIS